MKWLDRLTGNTPEVKSAIAQEKARLRQEGDEMLARIAADSAARRGAMDKAHAAQMAPLLIFTQPSTHSGAP